MDGSSTLNSSKRRGLGGPLGPKVRRSVGGTGCRAEEREEEEPEKEKEKEDREAESKHNSFQLSGKNLIDRTTRCLTLWII